MELKVKSYGSIYMVKIKAQDTLVMYGIKTSCVLALLQAVGGGTDNL